MVVPNTNLIGAIEPGVFKLPCSSSMRWSTFIFTALPLSGYMVVSLREFTDVPPIMIPLTVDGIVRGMRDGN